MDKINGGIVVLPSDNDITFHPIGIPLRDWFAGQALASGMWPFDSTDCDEVAAWCGKMADAMIRESTK